jgi:class 3 adenylate cyclase
MNKTSISSVVCFNIIDFTKKSEAEQKAAKKQLSALINLAVVDIPQKDRVIVDTEHGAIITCSGPLENALEDALFIALTVRDEVLNSNSVSDNPLYLLIGINLGSVNVTKGANANEAPNIIGDGLVEAQQIMSFANPNQILVSRAYYDMASKLTLEVAQMFEKYDMHAYKDDIYAVRRLSEKSTAVNSAAIVDNTKTQEESLTKSAFNWRVYVLPILLTIAILFVFTQWMNKEETVEVVEQPVITMPEMEEATTLSEESADPAEMDAIQNDVTPEKGVKEKAEQKAAVKKKTVKKKAVKEIVTTPEPKQSTTKIDREESAVRVETTESVEPTPEPGPTDKKSGWDTFKESIKQGSESECTQAEKIMNQCN